MHALMHPEGTTRFCHQPVLLKQYEVLLGQPYKDCPQVNWNTFPGLDPMVATV